MEAIEARALLKLRPIARSSQTDSPLSTRAGLIDAQEYGVPALKLYEKETNYRRASMANYPMAQIMGKEAAAAFNRPSKYPVSRYYDWVSRIAPPKIRSKKAAIKFVEDTPSLECQVLMELVDEKPEGRYGFCLHWKTNTLDLRFSGILAVKGRESEWVYIQRDGTNGVMDRQSIRVVSNSTGKRLFVCPFTNKASARLFYRDGCFASRTAQRLVNLSQRKRQVPRRPKLAPFF